jgi:hypothetical protein
MWRNAECPQFFVEALPPTESDALELYDRRVESFPSLLSFSLQDQQLLDRKTMMELVDDEVPAVNSFGVSSDPTDSVISGKLARHVLALFGWSYHYEAPHSALTLLLSPEDARVSAAASGHGVIHCSACQREISAPAFSQIKCIDDHRYFCPWLRKNSWKDLLEMVLTRKRRRLEFLQEESDSLAAAPASAAQSPHDHASNTVGIGVAYEKYHHAIQTIRRVMKKPVPAGSSPGNQSRQT